jgi:NitT/TauT family transport system substrate-binding protein
MFMKRGIALLAGGAIALGAAACSSSGGSDSSGSKSLPVIKVAVSQDASALDVLVGVQEGFFTKHGLDVDPVFVANSTTLPQVTGSQYQISSLTATQSIAADASGLSLVAISANRIDTPQNPTAGLIVAKGSGITSYKDLVGKSIGTPLVNGTLMLCILDLVKEQGGDYSKVQALEAATPQLPDLLAAGRFDAVTALQPYDDELTAQGYTDLGDPLRAIGDRAASALYVTSSSWADSNGSEISEWNAGLQEADDFIASHPAQAKQILEQKADESAASVNAAPLATYDATIPAGTLQAWVNIMKTTGALKGSVDVSSMLYSK